MKKRILIMAGYYVPSVKGGGPIQSIKNIVDNLSNEFDFYIVAADRDLGDNQPFDNIIVDDWIQVENATVYYTDITKLTLKETNKILNSIDYDVIYLNSFFSFKLSTVPILLSKLRRIPGKKTIIAPRGQFSSGALGLKSFKKKIYIQISKFLGFYKDIIWHSTTELEKMDIIKLFGNKNKILVANNLTSNYDNIQHTKYVDKKPGGLDIVFISRIHPKKNLKQAIEFLSDIEGDIKFNIYGPVEDREYWNSCLRSIRMLAKNIKVSYKGVVEHHEINNIFNNHHFLLFPTLGENYGHVILESLIGGCPVIISDQTPWLNLEEKQIGWDISLNNEKEFKKVIQQCVDLTEKEYMILSRSSFEIAKEISNSKIDIRNTRQLFSIIT